MRKPNLLPNLLLASILAAPVGAARGDTLDTLAAAQEANQSLNTCFDRNFEPGVDKAGDGGRSHRRLLAACDAEWTAAAQACAANSGTPLADCRRKTGSLVDDYLGLKGAGIQ